MASTQNLLDLPIEIFELIFDKYLESVPIKQAWHAREVCSTFKNVLTAKVIKLPGSAFELGNNSRSTIDGLITHGNILFSRTPEPRFRVVWCSNVIMLQFLLRLWNKGIDTALAHMLIKAHWTERVYRTTHLRKFRGEAEKVQSVAFMFRLKKQTDGSNVRWADVVNGQISMARTKRDEMTFATADKIVGKDEDNSGELAWGPPW